MFAAYRRVEGARKESEIDCTHVESNRRTIRRRKGGRANVPREVRSCDNHNNYLPRCVRTPLYNYILCYGGERMLMLSAHHAHAHCVRRMRSQPRARAGFVHK